MQLRRRDPKALAFLGESIARTRMLELALSLVVAALERDGAAPGGSFAKLVEQSIRAHRADNASGLATQLERLDPADQVELRRSFEHHIEELYDRLLNELPPAAPAPNDPPP